MNILRILWTVVACCCAVGGFVEAETNEIKFYIDGKLKVAGDVQGDGNWIQQAKIVVDDGRYIGIPK